MKISVNWFIFFLVGLTCGYFLQEGIVLTILWIVVVVVAIFLALVIAAVITAREGVKLVRELFSMREVDVCLNAQNVVQY